MIFKKYKKQLILSSIVILLPIVFGLLLWNRLPEQIPTHWNAAGEVDQYSSRAFGVFGIPLILLALHWLCLFVTKSDKGNKNQTPKVMSLVFWICPMVAVLCVGAVYLHALGMDVNMIQLPCILVGFLFVIVGNYLPKCKHNYTIGIKLPWTLASEENWYATHRFAGRIWVAGGFLFLVMAFLPEKLVFPALFAVILLLVLVPTVYSYRYMKKYE